MAHSMKLSQRSKLLIYFLLILALAGVVGVIDYPKGPNIKIGSFYRESKVRLGLDLQGGTHLVYQADVSKIDKTEANDALQGVRDVIERRVNQFGVSEPIVQTNVSGSNYRLIVELPGVVDINQAISLIGQTPLLEFREQLSDQEMKDLQAKIAAAQSAPDADVQIAALSQQQFKATELTGSQFKKAQVTFDQQSGAPQISLTFNDEGKKLFADITQRNIGKQVAIFLDGTLLSAPVVQGAITDGNAVITGKFTVNEAKDLARRLNAGALPVPITLVSQQNVGPTLGAESVQRSIVAGVVGFFIVALFMLVSYRLPGLLATISLLIYSLIVLAIFKMVPVTLTIAGVAGFILSIGMAVDANVLIFERFKEEMRHGTGLKESLEQGFRFAWSSIRDSNISTLITTVILAWFGTSIIKGFALTLAIGILISMFSAVVVTRVFLRLIIMTPLKKYPWLFGVKKTKGEHAHA